MALSRENRVSKTPIIKNYKENKSYFFPYYKKAKNENKKKLKLNFIYDRVFI